MPCSGAERQICTLSARGHIERACENKKRQSNKSTEQRKSDFRKYKKKVHKMEHTEDEQSDTLSEGEESLHVLSISDNGHGYWVTPLLDGNAVRMQVDTGAAISLLYTRRNYITSHYSPQRAMGQILSGLTGVQCYKAPSKVKAVAEAPSPQNMSQLRSFLGLLTYYAKFVPNLANMLKPLHELLNKTKQWKWTDRCEEAFKKVKTALAQSEALTHFNPNLPLQLACDASPYGVGAVVSHIMPSGEERPIAFASRTLSKAESNYAQIEREALAIVFGVKKFHQFLFGRLFTLLTDHRPLTSIFGPHTGIPSLAASRMQRWAFLLSAHQYDIKYRRSEQHCNADGLSRLPLPVAHTDHSQAEIFYFKEVTNAPVTSVQVKKVHPH
uniref:Reverse transcriptase/retrotransposon-derived protein RNase H-like domain-containing protein n=1 Tax=Hucho hucho TaxID=62062 RepID=A0A4W5R0Y7_9TELE